MRLVAAVFCLCVLPARAGALDAYGELAGQLFGNPVRGVKKVAVLPFASVESTGVTRGGLVLAERVGAAIAATGNVKLADRRRLEKTIAADFKPEAVPAGREAAELGKALGADAAVFGLFSDLGGGLLEVRAVLVIFPGGGRGPSGKVTAVRDWDGYQPKGPAPDGGRAALRALAAKGAPVRDTADWAAYASAAAGTLQGRLRAWKLGGGRSPAAAEIDSWRASPAEVLRKAYLPCAPEACAALGAAGPGYYKVYFPDGFSLKIDDAGTVLDLSYPDWKVRRAAMRTRAARFRPQGLRTLPDWAALAAPLEAEKDKAASPAEEAARWTFGPADAFSGGEHKCAERPAYCSGLGISAPAYSRFVFSDGFILVLDGVRTADCSYPPLEENK